MKLSDVTQAKEWIQLQHIWVKILRLLLLLHTNNAWVGLVAYLNKHTPLASDFLKIKSSFFREILSESTKNSPNENYMDHREYDDARKLCK